MKITLDPKKSDHLIGIRMKNGNEYYVNTSLIRYSGFDEFEGKPLAFGVANDDLIKILKKYGRVEVFNDMKDEAPEYVFASDRIEEVFTPQSLYPQHGPVLIKPASKTYIGRLFTKLARQVE